MKLLLKQQCGIKVLDQMDMYKRMGRPLPSIAPSNRIPLRLIG